VEQLSGDGVVERCGVVIIGAELNAEIDHASAHGKALGEKRPGEKQIWETATTTRRASMTTHEPSIADVIKNAIRDAQDLLRSEVALAKAEMRQEVRRLGIGAGLLAGAGLAAAIGVVFLMTTIAWAIPDLLGWPVWSGFGIVTVMMVVAAAVLGYTGKKRITAARHLPRTVDTLKENIAWMRARTS
jgi:ABC-type Fe3+-siderophore transport system permease subunit